MNELSALFSEKGGLPGLIIFVLVVLVFYLVSQLSKVIKIVLDFKSTMYKAGILPDRRHKDDE